MKKVLVCGAGGFIGSHIVKRLKKEGYWVRGVDIKNTEFSPTAADMGGMGFIHSAETEIMRNSVLININMTHLSRAA